MKRELGRDTIPEFSVRAEVVDAVVEEMEVLIWLGGTEKAEGAGSAPLSGAEGV